MKQILNALISGMEIPLDRIYKETLSLLLDGSGRILEIMGKEYFRHKDIVELFGQHGNIFEVFDSGGLIDLESAGSDSEFLIKREFNDIENTRDFFTDIPIILLNVFKVEGDRFLGVVRITGFVPQFPFSTANLVVFVDQEGKIRGINRNFFQVIGRPGKDPYSFLGHSVADFISPTPDEVQKRMLSDLRRAKETVSRKTHTEIVLDPGTTLSCLGKTRPGKSGGILWKNDGTTHDYVVLPLVVNTGDEDFRLSVIAENIRGQGPLLILGEPKTDLRDPDYNGYLAGEIYGGPGYMMKKRGISLCRKEHVIFPGKVEISFAKIGRGLFLDVNNRPVLEYYDPQIIHHATATPILGLRPGSEAVITGVSFRRQATSDREKPFSEQEVVVRLKSGPERYFTLAPLPNIYLSVRYPHITGYLLNDVTHFHEKAELFRKQYQQEKKRGEKLETLLGEFGRGNELFIGRSKDISNIKEKANVIAASSAAVLIQGATGTGKEVLARYIHGKSPRKDKPFIKVDCSALPATLIESELFGYEKGAFTGASESRAGRFEQANGGTLFLDEIGNLNASIQAKLLGVLQDFTITRLGGGKLIPLNIRLIAASNINVDALVKSGAFREDLFYRINTIMLILPPLKARREDIEPLCQYFIPEFNAGGHKNILGLTPAAYKRLYQYDWPGNIRELRNVIHQAHIFCEKEWIGEKDLQLPQVLPEASRARPSGTGNNHQKGLTRQKLMTILKKTRGNVSGIARELGITRKACYDNFRKFRITPGSFRHS